MQYALLTALCILAVIAFALPLDRAITHQLTHTAHLIEGRGLHKEHGK